MLRIGKVAIKKWKIWTGSSLCRRRANLHKLPIQKCGKLVQYPKSHCRVSVHVSHPSRDRVHDIGRWRTERGNTLGHGRSTCSTPYNSFCDSLTSRRCWCRPMPNWINLRYSIRLFVSHWLASGSPASKTVPVSGWLIVWLWGTPDFLFNNDRAPKASASFWKNSGQRKKT